MDDVTLDLQRTERLEGRTIGCYRILEEIGRGGMACVYRAVHLRLKREVAFKVIHGARSADPLHLTRFRREGRILSSMRHPGIVEVFDCDSIDGVEFFTMPLLSHPTLEDLVTPPRSSEGRLPRARAIAVVRSLLDALEALHGAGVVHRDVKPSNLFVSSEDQVILTDFGVARSQAETTSLTASGTTVGTLLYMAPEQIHGQAAEARTDLYAAGLVLCRITCGRLPFGAASELIAQKTQEPTLLSPEKIFSGIDADLSAIILRACARDPADRFASAASFSDSLAALLPPISQTTGPSGSAAGRREPARRRIRTMIIVSTAAILASVWFAVTNPSGPGACPRSCGTPVVQGSASRPAVEAPAAWTVRTDSIPAAGSAPFLATIQALWPGYSPSPVEHDLYWALVATPGGVANDAALAAFARIGRQVPARTLAMLAKEDFAPPALVELLTGSAKWVQRDGEQRSGRGWRMSPATTLRLILNTTARTIYFIGRCRQGRPDQAGVTHDDLRVLVTYLCLLHPGIEQSLEPSIRELIRVREARMTGGRFMSGEEDSARVGRSAAGLDRLLIAHFEKGLRRDGR